jgi:hypothetical protein
MHEVSVKAILARCGSITKALNYCADMAHEYPRLRAEYHAYHEILMGMRGSHT